MAKMKRFRVVVTYDFETEMGLDEIDALFFDVLVRRIRIPDLPKPTEIKVKSEEEKREIVTKI